MVSSGGYLEGESDNNLEGEVFGTEYGTRQGTDVEVLIGWYYLGKTLGLEVETEGGKSDGIPDGNIVGKID